MLLPFQTLELTQPQWHHLRGSFGPAFIARFVHTSEGRESLRKMIDSMTSGILTEETHADLGKYKECRAAYARTKREEAKARRAEAGDGGEAKVGAGGGQEENEFGSFECGKPVDAATKAKLRRWTKGRVSFASPKVQEMRAAGMEAAMMFQVHVHCSRCRKGAVGELQCAVCMGRPASEATTWDEVNYVDTEEEKKKGVYMQAMKAVPIERPPSIVPKVGECLGDADTRSVALTLARTAADKMVNEFSAVMMGFLSAGFGALGCNTSFNKFGAALDAVATFFYVPKYMSKNAFRPEESVSIAKVAHDEMLKYPSVAKDAQSDATNRQVKHFLAKLHNKVIKMSEYSREQCAAALLGIPSSCEC